MFQKLSFKMLDTHNRKKKKKKRRKKRLKDYPN